MDPVLLTVLAAVVLYPSIAHVFDVNQSQLINSDEEDEDKRREILVGLLRTRIYKVALALLIALGLGFAVLSLLI